MINNYSGSLVFLLIFCCLLFGKDPDNIAPPAAAALGDFATVTVLIYINRLYVLCESNNQHIYFPSTPIFQWLIQNPFNLSAL